MKQYNNVGTVGRFRPLHLGAATMLEVLCEQAYKVLIGIGSSNKYDIRNPFYPDEVKHMMDLYLSQYFKNYEIKFILDFGHIPKYRYGHRWIKEIIAQFGKLDAFVTGNEYTKKLLEPHFKIISSYDVTDNRDHINVKGTYVRYLMALGDDYKPLVPKIIIPYLESGLVQRMRKEFGEEIIQTYWGKDLLAKDNYDEERSNITKL